MFCLELFFTYDEFLCPRFLFLKFQPPVFVRRDFLFLLRIIFKCFLLIVLGFLNLLLRFDAVSCRSMNTYFDHCLWLLACFRFGSDR